MFSYKINENEIVAVWKFEEFHNLEDCFSNLLCIRLDVKRKNLNSFEDKIPRDILNLTCTPYINMNWIFMYSNVCVWIFYLANINLITDYFK